MGKNLLRNIMINAIYFDQGKFTWPIESDLQNSPSIKDFRKPM